MRIQVLACGHFVHGAGSVRVAEAIGHRGIPQVCVLTAFGESRIGHEIFSHMIQFCLAGGQCLFLRSSITRLRSPWGTTALKRWRTDAENLYDARSVAAVMGSILVMRHTQSLGGSL